MQKKNTRGGDWHISAHALKLNVVGGRRCNFAIFLVHSSQGCGAGAEAAGTDTFWSQPEPESEPPKRFARSRSRSRRNGLLRAGAGAGAVKNGAVAAPERDTIVEK